MSSGASIQSAYDLAKARYAEIGVDADAAMATLKSIPISIHCWQGDDVGGFERASAGDPGGGLAVTGNYPGKARSPEELRGDFGQALRLIPGRHRINLHASYGEFGGRKVDRNAVAPEHFRGWIDWAKQLGIGIDFNPTYFAHPLAADGFTLSHRDEAIRRFWVEHGMATRTIAAAIGQALGTPCVNNVWIPDGMKDTPADRLGPRQRLERSLDEMFAAPLETRHMLDAVEGKLFGLGSESYVVGSHEFYFGYAVRKNKLLCLDAGHYHPTESMADKISAVLCSLKELLLHVSRGVRWDSDHVVVLDDALREIAREIVVHGFLGRVHIGLDYFDASINRVAAWVAGVRNMQKALLLALLEPAKRLREMESAGDYTGRLVLMEECRTLPAGAVWDRFCAEAEAPVGVAWLEQVRRYEREVLSRRA